MLPLICDGCASKMLPSCSVFFLRFTQKLYASLVKLYCLTRMLYFTPSFSDVEAMKVTGLSAITFLISLAEEFIMMLLDASLNQHVLMSSFIMSLPNTVSPFDLKK